MPSEGSNGSPSKTSINTSRLSAMMDSLDGLGSNTKDISNENAGNSATKEKEPIKESNSSLVPPPTLADLVGETSSPKSFLYNKSPVTKSPGTYSQFSPSGTRLSMYSNYSGVIQEGTGVSYVVKNNMGNNNNSNEEFHNDFNENMHTDITGLNEAPDIKISDASNEAFQNSTPSKQSTIIHRNQGTKGSVIIKTIPNAKPVSRYSSLSSKQETIKQTEPMPALPNMPTAHNTIKTSSSEESIHLTSDKKKGISKNLSIDSGNMASESGSSAYYPFHNNHNNNQMKEPLLGNHEVIPSADHTPTKSLDNESTTSSELPPLQTYQTSSIKSLTPDRSELTDYNPTVPLRNRNRPATRSFLNNELDKIESELKEEMNENNQSHVTMHTKDGDSYFSAESEEPNEEQDQLYRNRRVPTNPTQIRDNNNSINKNKVRSFLPHIANIANPTVSSNNNDDGFEDIDEGHIFSNHPSRSSRDTHNRASRSSRETHNHRQKQNKTSRQRTNASNSFDTNTLSQLLMITKGTLVGSEFTNLGMKTEEKLALERLVDSLSRLTADMILDPDRYDEGIRRLGNAVKALDGF
ncbi:hypothetical protein C6P45_002852 [Maudiozyma exigua]|uniref:Protein NBA1 n=1 Tax=Maudiozyma exigua TaxID=34358 RepID=A0A9P6WF16_MAUEX|nr:hypothetical protein C6P45_002852 [Kazachstania exigua]